jgi:hypothetical protein
MIIKEMYAKATLKDVIKYKFNWVFKLYLRYVELYDFGNLF